MQIALRKVQLCRSIIAVSISTTTLVMSSSPAFADSNVTGSGGVIVVNSSGVISYASPGGIDTTSTTKYVYYNGWPIKQTVPQYYVYSPIVVQGIASITNEPCIAVSKSQPYSNYWEAYQIQQSAVTTWESLAGSYPTCNYVASTKITKEKISPGQLITQYWNQSIANQLPTLNPSVPPGFALTGLPVYLTSNCVLDRTFNDNTPLGAATIWASGQIWVKWRSGTSWSGPYNSCGAPWPNGNIAHTFEFSGSTTVQTKETWTAHWQLAGAHGSLYGLATFGPTISLPIRSLSSEIYT